MHSNTKKNFLKCELEVVAIAEYTLDFKYMVEKNVKHLCNFVLIICLYFGCNREKLTSFTLRALMYQNGFLTYI